MPADPHERSGPGATADPLLDAIAAEFYENRLRLSQSRRIEAETARRYLSLPDAAKSRFRAKRREIWRRMSEDERALLRSVKLPRYSNLTEDQKQAFRRIAAQELGIAPTPTVSISLSDEI